MKFLIFKLMVPIALQAATITSRLVSPPATNASRAVTVTTAGTVRQVLRLSLTDGVAAAGGGTGCIGVGNPSTLATAVGANGTSALGTFNTAFTTGGPTGAQGCTTPTSVAAVQTFQLNYTTPRSALINIIRVGGFTWSSVRVGVGNNLDWSSDSTGINVTTTAQTLIPLSGGPGVFSTPVQVAWRAAYNAASGAKTGRVRFTILAP